MLRKEHSDFRSSAETCHFCGLHVKEDIGRGRCGMKYRLLAISAWIRGLFYQHPRFPKTPTGYSSVYSGLTDSESRLMYERHGWIPYCFERTKGGMVARMWICREGGRADVLELGGQPGQASAGRHDEGAGLAG